MKYGEAKKQEHTTLIKRVLINNPNATIRQISELLERPVGTRLDKDYINRLIHKIREERINRYSKTAKNEMVAKFEDFVQDLERTLRQIINNPDANETAKISAVRTIVQNYKEVLTLMMDLGLLDRAIGTIKTEVYDVVQIAKLVKEVQDEKSKRNK